jgi:hypothetical protein
MLPFKTLNRDAASMTYGESQKESPDSVKRHWGTGGQKSEARSIRQL